MKYPLCIVNFRDIVGDSTWSGVDEIDPIDAKHAGWLVYEDSATIKIASTLDADEAPSGITAFPRGTVSTIHKIHGDY